MGGSEDVVATTAVAIPKQEKESNADSGTGTAEKKRFNRRRRGKKSEKAEAYKTEQPSSVTKQPKFEGKCDDLKGYVYDCSSYKQADNYNRTTKEIAEFVGRTYKYGSDARLAITNLAAPVFTEPADLAATGVSAARKRLWERQVDELGKRESYLEENMKTIYSLVWGQCTEIMRQRLEALPNFNTMSTKGDSVGLLKAIKSLVYNFRSQKYLPHSLHLAAQQFYNCKQSKRMTTQAYIEEFQSRVDVIKESGGSIGHSPEMVKRLCKQKGTPMKDMDKAATLAIQKESKERYLAVAIMIGADRSRFGTLLEDLQNDYLQKRDNYGRILQPAD
jgi:hypothetical protein